MWDYFPFVCFVVFALALNFYVPLGWGDDTVFAQKLTTLSIPEYVANEYNSWSSRVFINAVMFALLKLPAIVWRVANTVVMFSVAWGIYRLLPPDMAKQKRNVRWVIVALLVMYPWNHMASAGWIATTLNYLWVGAAVIVALIPIKKILLSETIAKWEYPLYAVALIFGLNAEQGAVVLLFMYAVAAIYFLVKKRRAWFVWVNFVLCIVGLLFILNAPGNAIRLAQETETYFPAFSQLSVLQKMGMGVLRTLEHFLFAPNMIMLTSLILLTACLFRKFSKPIARFLGSLPLCVYTLFGIVLYAIPAMQSPAFMLLSEQTVQTGVVPQIPDVIATGMFPNLYSFVAFVLLAAVSLFVCISPFLLMRSKTKALFTAVFLVACFAVTCAMGFSPTIFASGKRTFMYMYLGIILYAALLFGEIDDVKMQNRLKTLVIFIAAVAVVLLLVNRA